MFLQTQYLSIDDLSKIYEIVSTFKNYDFSEQLLGTDLYCIIRHIDISQWPLKYFTELRVISNKIKLIDQLQDSDKIFMILSKNPHVEEIERNTKLEYLTPIEKEKIPYYLQTDISLFLK